MDHGFRLKIFPVAMVLGLVCVTGAGSMLLARGRSQPRTRPHDEPFCSFHLLDSQLSLLQQQYAALQKTLKTAGQAENVKNTSRLWDRAAKDMSQTSRSIEQLASRLQYRYRKRRFGARLFGQLKARASAVSQTVAAMGSARDRATARSAASEFDQQMVALVLQYDSISSGYASLHCSPGEWTCCEPKKDLAPGRKRKADACRWLCTKQRSRCSGFLGPRTAK